jgi:hypothetical protein
VWEGECHEVLRYFDNSLNLRWMFDGRFGELEWEWKRNESFEDARMELARALGETCAKYGWIT